MMFNIEEVVGINDWFDYYKSSPVNFKVGERLHIMVMHDDEPFKQLIFVCKNVSDDIVDTYIGFNVPGHVYTLEVTSNSIILERSEIITTPIKTYKKITNYVYFEYEKEVIV